MCRCNAAYVQGNRVHVLTQLHAECPKICHGVEIQVVQGIQGTLTGLCCDTKATYVRVHNRQHNSVLFNCGVSSCVSPHKAATFVA